jgi:hypothetical protein
MTKVKDLIEYLKTQDQEADVFVYGERQSAYSSYVEEIPLDLKEHVEYIDLRGNQFVKETDIHYNARSLTLGYKD